MERLVKYHGMNDSLRNTMLRHEEIFRQQVHELHRLYRIQKMLMTETAKICRLGHTRTRNFGSASTTSETTHPSSHVSNANLLSNCSGNQLNIVRGEGFNLGRPAEEFTSKGENGARQKIHEMWPDDESEVELTLSVGCGSHHTKEQANSSSSSSSSSSLDRKRLKSPSWLMQGSKFEQHMKPYITILVPFLLSFFFFWHSYEDSWFEIKDDPQHRSISFLSKIMFVLPLRLS